ncbi:MAG: hypothetical protein E7191_06390 [Erysipelotrichaceae bacterium]|nr:hypothetical protein [Erysipelotrichaceae bacterium]
MKIQLVCEELFSPQKSKVIYKRFLDYIEQHPSDALCIANATAMHVEQIESFKYNFMKKGKGTVFVNNVPLMIYDQIYSLVEGGIRIREDEMIYAADDAICEINIDLNGRIFYEYIALDLLLNAVPAKKKEVRSFDLPMLEGLPKDGKPVVMPLQKFIEMIEENMDDETREKIRKAKEDFNSKTKN